MRYILWLLIINYRLCGNSIAPSNSELFWINSGIGSAMAVVGGWFHRKKRPFRPWRNFLIGGIGGGIHFMAKKNVGDAGINRLNLEQNNLTPLRAWSTKIMTNIATSMVENAVHNQAWNHAFSMDVGPFYFTLKQDSEKNWQFQKRLHAGAAFSTMHFLVKGYKFDVKNSLRTGNSVFRSDHFSGLKSSLPESEIGAGTNMYGSVVLKEGKDGLLNHEIIHTYQNRFLDALSPHSSYEGDDYLYISYGRFVGTPRYRQSYEKNWFEKEAHALDMDGFYFRQPTDKN